MVLERWQNESIEPPERLPGAYPPSIVTTSSPDGTFVTAVATMSSRPGAVGNVEIRSTVDFEFL